MSDPVDTASPAVVPSPADPTSAGQYWAFWHYVGIIGRRGMSGAGGVRSYRLDLSADYRARGFGGREIHQLARELRRAGFKNGQAEKEIVAASQAAYAAGMHDSTNLIREIKRTPPA